MNPTLRLMTLVAAAGLAGCGVSPPPTTDPGRGVATLRGVLEAWQAGTPPDALQSRSPPVTAADKDWAGGAKLARFEIDEAAARPAGYDVSVPVRLWLGDGKKPPVRVRYVVALSPNVVVTRDFGG